MTEMKAKRIGVLMGGVSAEREVSLKTGAAIARALRERGYQAMEIDAADNLPSLLVENHVEVAFVALHGRFGEDGAIQGMLEVMRIPYTGSGVLASALAMDKAKAKEIFEHHGIPTPAFRVLDPRRMESEARPWEAFGLPVVVKPINEGSTIGVAIVRKEEEFVEAVHQAAAYDRQVLLERYIPGKEVTVAVLNGEGLPIIEIVPKGGFYDYRRKYTKGETEYLVPAPLKKVIYEQIQRLSAEAYRVLGCEGCARVDLRLDEIEGPYVLEVNTMPGMTETSLVPKAAQAAGMNFGDLVEKILDGASLKIFPKVHS